MHGRRKEKEDEGKVEVVLFAGWDSVSQHYELSWTPRHEAFGKSKGLIDGAEVGHAMLMEL